MCSQRKYTFYHQNTLLDAFRTNSRNIIGRDLSMVIPLPTNQDLTPMLISCKIKIFVDTLNVGYFYNFFDDVTCIFSTEFDAIAI